MKFLLTSDTHFNESVASNHSEFLAAVKQAIDSQKVDALIHAGDWSSSSIDEIEAAFKEFREVLGNDFPILAVWGNHDYWEQGSSWGEIMYRQKELLIKYNIHHLQDNGPWEKDGVTVAGFNGWYGNHSSPATRDLEYMPKDIEGCPTHIYLANEAAKSLDKILYLPDTTKLVVVSHFPTFIDHPAFVHMGGRLSFMPFIAEKAAVFCVGHSHRTEDFKNENCRILNSGSDYGRPKYKIFEVI